MRDKVLREISCTPPPQQHCQISHDKDYVVVGSSAEGLLAHNFQQVGAAFPVFLHPETKDEYALARREVKTGDKHTDFAFDFSPDVTLEEDAQRRDFTINALYYDEASGELLDPTGQGLQDCKDGVLRHTSQISAAGHNSDFKQDSQGRQSSDSRQDKNSFTEDPLRIVRCARLAAQLGFSVAAETVALIKGMVRAGMLDHLSRERIDNEFMRALSPGYDSSRFLSYLHKWGALRELYPELKRLCSCKENPRYHWAKTSWGHVLAALDSAREQSAAVKTAVVYHDIYKPIAYARKKEAGFHFPHDNEQALAYLQKYLSMRKFDARTKKLCRLAVQYHMRFRLLHEGMHVAKWVDLIGAVSGGFRPDYHQQLIDILAVCRADETSDRPQDSFNGMCGNEHFNSIETCALQTFDVCSQIHARDLSNYAELRAGKDVDQLKRELRHARITAVKQQVDFFAC